MVDSNEEIMDATAEMIDTAEATTETTAPAAENPGLSLSDIKGCVSIIDIVTKRGAFEGPELAEVGTLRNRLDSFLTAAAAAEAPATEAPETEATA
jgi:hypothetical protein|tara:strand:+ start:1561 stop:1848 length:288 start_codon:yes stop_codon:yes gene_type:complete